MEERQAGGHAGDRSGSGGKNRSGHGSLETCATSAFIREALGVRSLLWSTICNDETKEVPAVIYGNSWYHLESTGQTWPVGSTVSWI